MTIIVLAVAWLAGLWLASRVELPSWAWLGVGLAAAALALAGRRRPPVRLAFACLAALAFAGLRYLSAQPIIDAGHVAAYHGADVTLSGVVVKEPEVRERTLAVRLRAEEIVLPGGRIRPVAGLVHVIVPRFADVRYGDRLQASGELAEPGASLQFNYRAYLARQGIHSEMAFPSLTVAAAGQGNPILAAIYRFRDRGRATIRALLPDPQAALLTGILLGDDSRLPRDLDDAFRVSGLSHIIAISGFNIALLAGALLAVARPFFGPQKSGWIALVGVGLYTVLVGADAAVVRAAIMAGTFIIAARLLGRPTFAPAGLFTAALLMTLADPNILWDAGFQLSFAATLGLMLYSGPLARFTEAQLGRLASPDLARRLTRAMADVVLATLTASLLTLPLIMVTFGQLSLVSPLANLLVLPAQPAVMLWGGLATIAGMVAPALGQPLAWVAWLFLTYTIELVQFLGRLPGAAVPVSVSPGAGAALYGAIFGLTWLARRPRAARAATLAAARQRLGGRAAFAGVALAAVLATAWAFGQPDGRLHVAFLDVGQGDATLIVTPGGRQILVDGGLYPAALSAQLGHRLPFWDRDIDLVIATHPDDDHVAGLPELLDRYRIQRLVTNGRTDGPASYVALLAAAAGQSVPIHRAQAGELILLDDGVRLEVLGPAEGFMPANSNDGSLALRLVYGEFALLMTGDAGEEAERLLMAGGRDLTSLVYKAGHHGAATSSSAELLAAVRPQVVVVSAGAGNAHGHPAAEMLARAAAAGATVLRTDELGTIELTTDGQQLWWSRRP